MTLLSFIRRLFARPQTSRAEPSAPPSAPAQPQSPAQVEEQWTEDQQRIHAAIKSKAEHAKLLIESDWKSIDRAAMCARATEVLALFTEIDSLLAGEGRFVNFTFVERDRVERAMLRMLRFKQPLHLPQNPDHVLVAIIDTETTGLGPDDEPITVGALLVEVDPKKGDVARIADSYYGTRAPRCAISTKAHAVHGLTASDLAGTRLDLMALQKITDSASLLIAHNAKFDRRMLAQELDHVLDSNWACSIHSLRDDWARLTGGSRSLDAICQALAVQRRRPHNALGDCHALLDALRQRTGKTARSSTLMGRLIRNAWAPPPD